MVIASLAELHFRVSIDTHRIAIITASGPVGRHNQMIARGGGELREKRTILLRIETLNQILRENLIIISHY